MSVSFMAAVVVLAGLLCSRAGAMYWQIVLCLFGASAAITLPGGAVITPAVLFLPFLALRAWFEQHGQHYERRVPIAGVWLALVVIFGVVGAYFAPRLFAGTMEVVSIDRSGGNTGLAIGPLGPVSGNITQSGYALGALIAFFSFHALLKRSDRLACYRDAVLLVAALDCLAAGLNIAEYRLGFPPILDYVRNAYALFGDYEVEGTGLMRIHGTFSETAAFSGFSLPLCAFTFSLWMHHVRPWLCGTLTLALLVFILISTSTTAYVALAFYVLMLGFLLTYRGYINGTVPRIGVLVAGSLLLVVVIGSAFVFETHIAEGLRSYFARTVFNKMESASGIERGYWNRQAWSNFLDTYGIGVGLGTVRSSSYILVLLSNLGVIGTLMYMMFLRRLFVGALAPAPLEPITEAARQALLATLAPALASGTVFDLGIMFYAHAAVACAWQTRAAELPPPQALRIVHSGIMSRRPPPSAATFTD
jgi:hypothetical protein